MRNRLSLARRVNAIFYIYHEAGLAVFLAGCAALEIACGFAVPGLQDIANIVGGVALCGALVCVLSIVRAERVGA